MHATCIAADAESCRKCCRSLQSAVDGTQRLRACRPDSYFSQLGPDGRRVDVYERPELCRGAVEFVATSEYMVSRLPTRNLCSQSVQSVLLCVCHMLLWV